MQLENTPSKPLSSSRLIRLAGMILVLGSCCSALTGNGEREVVKSPVVVVRGVFAGWIVTTSSRAPRSREFETWEVRISLDGRTQEARGWHAADGFLPAQTISPAEAAHFYELAQSLVKLRAFVGQIATDTPYRQIEFTVGGVTRTISGYTAGQSDRVAERFDQVWTEIAKRFPERTACQ